MERFCFINALSELENKNLDRHIQIKKYMREERPEINDQFDI